jgi:hypothetical protein
MTKQAKEGFNGIIQMMWWLLIPHSMYRNNLSQTIHSQKKTSPQKGLVFLMNHWGRG